MFGKRSAKPNEASAGKTGGDRAQSNANDAVSLDIVEQTQATSFPEEPTTDFASALPDEDAKYNDTKQKVFSALVDAVDALLVVKAVFDKIHEAQCQHQNADTPKAFGGQRHFGADPKRDPQQQVSHGDARAIQEHNQGVVGFFVVHR